MNELKSLAQYVTDNRRRPSSERLKRYEVAVEFLKSSPRVSDEELGKLLGMNPKDTSFRMFKSRLRKKLLRLMLNANLAEKYQNPYSDAILHCAVLQYAVRFLLLSGNRVTMASLASEGLAKAIEFSLTEYVVFFARYLRGNASIRGNEKLFNQYKDLGLKAIDTLHAEEEAGIYSESLTMEHAKNVHYPKKLIQIGERYIARVQELRNRYDSFNLNISYYRLNGQVTYSKQDFRAGLANWTAFEKYLDKFRHFDVWGRISEALIHQLNCRIHIKQYNKAEDVIEKLNSIVKPGSLYWPTVTELQFLLYMHSRRYAEAKQVYRSMLKSSIAATLKEHEIERWELFSVYLLFIDTFLDAEGQAIRFNNKRKIKDLIRNSPGAAKDKQGYNVSILIIQTLWRMAENDFPSAAEGIRGLEKYADRYLQGEEYSRSFIFIRMLSALEKEHFSLKKAGKAINPLLQELNKLSEGSGGKLIDGMEVIPYPHLWEIVVSILKKHFAG